MFNGNTLLELLETGVPIYSARDLTQTLSPIAASIDARRDINGTLRDLSNPQFQKYSSKITCTDQRSPAIDGMWPGRVLTVYCVCELACPIGSHPLRPVVSGSQRDEEHFTFYRPILEMMVTSFSSQLDEWTADVQWELDLEEL